jgi:hypothetical protein
VDRLLTAILIGLACGLVLGVFTARSSARRDRVYGGVLAQVFHYLGAASFVSALPGVLAAVFLGQGVLRAAAVGFGFMLLSLALLLVYALFERGARARLPAAPAESWTADKARTSGL